MNNDQTSLHQSIASNKFYPPIINQSQSLPRHHLIADQLEALAPSKKIVVVEAQAGQGKTMLVHQFLDQQGFPYIWYQVGSEDNDPVILISALQLALSRSIDDFSSPQLTEILEKGQVGPMDLQGCANILLHDIDSCLETDIYIVFDDLHLISHSTLTNNLLDYLIDTSPPRLHFIFTSRHPLQLNARLLKNNPHQVYLGTDDLALDSAQISSLYREIFDLEITRNEAEEIFEITNGWIMGIVLSAHPLSRKQSEDQKGERRPRKLSKRISDGSDGIILSFFKEEIFSHVPPELHQTFMKLSYLDEIDIRLARKLANIDDIELHLDRMANENFFVYRLDDQNQVFRFHHLFQEFLQLLGRNSLGKEIIGAIYRLAADYYLENDLVEKALKALRSGEDYPRMEMVLQSRGLQLLSANRTVTILGILQTVPEKTLLEHGWLTFFQGLLATDFTPRQTLPFFESCIKQFADEREEAGELMSLSQIIYFHFVISGCYKVGSRLLERTRDLFERNHQILPDEIGIIVARNLAAGYCFFDGNIDQARKYATLAAKLATAKDSKNFIATTRFILGYIELLSGNLSSATMETERSFSLASDPLVGMSNRLTLHVMQLCGLSMSGNLPGFVHQKEMVKKSIDQVVVRQTIAAPYLYVWSGIGQISIGAAADAIETIEQGMLVSKTAATDHMTSQFLQWRGFARALNGQPEPAIDDLNESAHLREESGGPFFYTTNLCVFGAALAVLGKYSEARTKLNEALTVSETIASPYLATFASAYLAYIELQDGTPASALESVERWLKLMIDNQYNYFWGWVPEIMATLFSFAITHKIEEDFVRACARKRLRIAFSEKGDVLPLLDIRILGSFSVGPSSGPRLGPEKFSGLQRELFGLLIASPDQKVSQEQVQLAFWPDSAPDKARKSFDTMLSRLRKVLSEVIDNPIQYLSIEKGYVQLSNVIIDGINFMQFAEHGLSSWKQNRYWQAENGFAAALSCWQSFVPAELFIGDQAIVFTDDLHHKMKEMIVAWCAMLSDTLRLDEAIQILEKTDKILALDEDCITIRYQLYRKRHNPLKARNVIANYRKELLRLEYTSEEADEIIVSLTEGKTVH